MLALVLGVVESAAVAAVEAPAVPAAWVTAAVAGWLVLGVGAGTNEMFTVCCLPPASPKARTHESPAVIWAAVGGHGYLGASVAGALSAAVGGGTRREQIARAAAGRARRACNDGDFPESPPLDEVVISPAAVGAVQLTGSFSLIGPRVRVTVGWLESLLHSRSAPGEPLSNPEPVTVTTEPPFRQVPGLAVMLGPDAVEVVDVALQGTVVVVVRRWSWWSSRRWSWWSSRRWSWWSSPAAGRRGGPAAAGRGRRPAAAGERDRLVLLGTSGDPEGDYARVTRRDLRRGGRAGVLAASVAAGLPPESVPAPGGPVTPVTMENVVARLPLASACAG